MRYYQTLIGLRGCYMPDSNSVAAFATRRALKEHIESEAGYQNEAGDMIGLSKRDVAWAAAHAWRHGSAILPFGRRGGDKNHSIEIERCSRADYLEAQEAGDY